MNEQVKIRGGKTTLTTTEPDYNWNLADGSLGVYSGHEPVSTGNKMKSIKIKQLDYGYLVEVGCQSLAISTKEELIRAFTEYINNPDDTREKFLTGQLFTQVEK